MNLTNKERDTILVVDDQPNNLKVISSVLGKEYNLSIADSGAKALKILDKLTPNMILLDIMMPEMDGYQVCKIIKQHDKLKEVPIIFLTAKTDIDDVVKGFELGAVDYITKPFNIHELRVRLKNHLNLHHAKQMIIHQRSELEQFNFELLLVQKELEKRNEDLSLAHDAIEEHAYRMNALNQRLLVSEYQLKASNEELLLANKEKDKFFSIIAHDLKSPLSGLNGLLEIITDDIVSFDEEERKEMLQVMLKSSKNVYSLLENLLEWSRIQRKLIKFNPDKVYPNSVVSNIIDITKAQANLKEISIVSQINKELVLNADLMMVSTVFRNLISNAIKFTPNKGKIEIGISQEESNTEQTCFFVSDNGVGMTEKIMNKLFRIDEHITSKGTENETGTGLGLILCKEFIELHGGSIWVESEEGKGSTFYFTLPINNTIE